MKKRLGSQISLLVLVILVGVGLALVNCVGSGFNPPAWAKGIWNIDGSKVLEVTNTQFIITASGASADWVKFGKVETKLEGDVFTFSVTMKGVEKPTEVTLTKKDADTLIAKGHHWGSGKELKK